MKYARMSFEKTFFVQKSMSARADERLLRFDAIAPA